MSKVRTRSRLFALLIALSMVGACHDEGLTAVVMLMNNSDDALHFEIVTEEGIPFDLVKTARPGEKIRLLSGSQVSDGSGLMRDGCTVGELRAIAADGRVVERFPPPICVDATLVVGGGVRSS